MAPISASYSERLPSRRKPTLKGAGFTLIELLVVISIMVIIAGLSVGLISSLLASNNLSNTAQFVKGQLTFARQSAIATNNAVEVRFYSIADGVHPASKAYRAMQCFQETTSGTNPLTKATIFPTGIIFSSNTAVSTLFNTSASGFGISSSTGDSAHPLPPPNNSSPFLYFRYKPTGQTDLAPPAITGTASPWITLYSETAPVISNTLPANFITVQVDIMNGTIRSYQP
jgi:uncharacterized protein (TIGR02596 family)